MAGVCRSAAEAIRSLRHAAGQLSWTTQRVVRRAGCGPETYRPRGCRAGLHVQRRRVYRDSLLRGFPGHCSDVTPVGTTEVMQIPVVTGRRMPTLSRLSTVAKPVRAPVRITVQTFEQFVPCFFTANLRGGFVHKTDELEAVLRENDVDIACTTETWLTKSVPNDVVNIHGYVMHRSDRKNGRRGGGVAVFMRHSLPCSGCLRWNRRTSRRSGCCTDNHACHAPYRTSSSAPSIIHRQLTTGL